MNEEVIGNSPAMTGNIDIGVGTSTKGLKRKKKKKRLPPINKNEHFEREKTNFSQQINILA